MSESPQTTVQVAGSAANALIEGLKTQPILLMLLVLNLVMFVVGYMFLNSLAKHISERDQRYISLLERCIIETSPLRGPESQFYPGSTRNKEDSQ